MTHTKYMMGVDIGTTSTKAVLFSKEGKILTQSAAGYPLNSPSPSVAEQHPDDIVKAVNQVIREIMDKKIIQPEELGFISFSSAMHSLIAVDSTGNPLTESITWADSRSEPYAEKIKKEHNGHEIYLRTGTPIHPMSPLSKIFWLKHDKPDLFKQTAKFIGIKEYVFYKLFNEYVVDYSIASATGMFHLENLAWDEEALNLLGISNDQLSAPVPTTHSMNTLQEKTADSLGLNKETPFIIGASDGVLSNLGVNAIEPGVVALTIGTSGAIRTVNNKPRTDPKGRTFCYALTEDHWVIGGPVNNGGMILRWLKEQLGEKEQRIADETGADPYDLITQKAENIPAGSDGLIFHPYFSGERAPLWNANARGSFFGFALNHTREHMIRAVMEGVMFNLYSVMLALQELIGMPKSIQATGGFARSELWRQIMADIFNQKVMVPESFESSCLGAAVLGLYALGEVDSLSVVKEMVGETHSHIPQQENVPVYEDLMGIYLSISRKMTEDYDRIAEFQKNH